MNLSGQSGGRASRTVSLQSLPVVGSIVSEDLAHGIELTAVANKPIPEIVTDLVTKVTEQRPVRLVHGAATPFPLDVVGLLYSERNKTVVVAGQDLRAG